MGRTCFTAAGLLPYSTSRGPCTKHARGVVAGLNSSLRANSLFKFAMRQNSHQMAAVTLEELQVKLLFFLRGVVMITVACSASAP